MTEDINLDDPRVFQKYDPDGMLTCLREMPGQCQLAWQMATDFNLPADYSEVNKVVVLGMGGSAIGSDLINGIVTGDAKLPIIVNRDYHLPAFVDAKTLVIASSYSGNTEETLSAFGESLATKAKKLAVTTGGKLKAMAVKANVPVFNISYQGQPRAALGFGLLPVLCFLQRLGLISDRSADVQEMVGNLQGMVRKANEEVALSSNPAKQMAQYLYGNIPIVYGAGILAEVAHRWKTQLNENSKAWAFHDVFPELDHNAVVGYQFPGELANRIKVILLRSSLLPPRILQRYRLTGELLERAGISYQFVEGEGSSPLSQVMSLVLFGDYVSCYLAVLYRGDPTPVKAIDYLKEQLGKDKQK